MEIEVSEAVQPNCKRVSYPVEEYFSKYDIFDLWRYEFIDSVPAALFEIPDCTPNPGIALNYGTKANYADGKDVVISVFNDGDNVVEIYCGDSLIETLSFSGKCRIMREFESGYYTVNLKNTGEELHFCVNAPKIEYSIKNDVITIDADSCDRFSSLMSMDFRLPGEGRVSLVSVEPLTEEERMTGRIVRFIPKDAGNFKLYFRNKYGIWSTGLIKI